MTDPVVSVIVPVYKVEPYLDRCVQSIVDQTYRNLEIILVDDGSPDNCPAMCDAWAEKDKRIKVIHKENGGGAQARNIGLDISSGAYIGFIDSDDFILPSFYEKLYAALTENESQIAECAFSFVDQDGTPLARQKRAEKGSVFNTAQAMSEHLADKRCAQTLWNKLYERQTIGATRFVEGKTIDDEFFTYRVIAKAERIVTIEDRLYCYRQQPDSVMHQTFSLKRLDAVEAKEQRLHFIEKQFPSLEGAARSNLLFSCLYLGQMSYRYLAPSERDAAIRYLKQAVSRNSQRGSSYSEKSWKQKMWRQFLLCSFSGACKLRNRLGIGL